MSKILKVNAHCQDRCVVQIDGKERDGYVPKGLGIGSGDYISIEIDLETGQIVGWKEPTAEVLDEVFNTEINEAR